MDANKLKVLKEINYQVRKTCGNCKYSRLGTSNQFGTCCLHKYSHLKHSESERELSINAYGYCGKHEWDEQVAPFVLGGFNQLREK